MAGCVGRPTGWLVVLVAILTGHPTLPTSTPDTDDILPTLPIPLGRLSVDYPMRNVTRREGETARLRCEVSGDPLPRYRWLKDDRHITIPRRPGARFNSRPTPWGSRLKIIRLQSSDSGVYTCEATNRVGKKHVSAYLKVLPGVTNADSPDGEPNWSEEPHNHYVPNEDDDTDHRTVYDPEDRRGPSDRDAVDHDTVDRGDHGLMDRGSIDHSSTGVQQRHGGRRKGGSGKSRGGAGFCQPYRGYACAKHINNRDIFVASARQQSRSEKEVTVAVTLMASSELSQRCGLYVIPALCVTAFPLCGHSGATAGGPRHLCKRDCLALQEDFCRDEYLRHHHTPEPFFLPNCTALPASGPADDDCVTIGLPLASSPPESSSRRLLLILVPVIASTAVLLVILAAVCGCRHRRHADRAGESPRPPELKAMLPPPLLPEIVRSSVRVLAELGEGSYGKLYVAELGEASVVVKVLSSAATPRTKTAFQRELEAANGIEHASLARLIGACLRDTSFACLIYESPPVLEDLSAYARRNAPAAPEVLRLTSQVAAGLDHLAARHLTHGDVAARNVAVFSGTARLTSFALSRDVHSTDYGYHPPTDSQRPLRWMSPQALETGVNTTAGDIWAFGVMLWEALSGGARPYDGYSNVEAVHMIQSHQVLACPPACAPRVYAVLVDCWQMEPLRRPGFGALMARLRQLLAAAGGDRGVQRPVTRDSGSAHSSAQSQRSSGNQALLANCHKPAVMHGQPANQNACYKPPRAASVSSGRSSRGRSPQSPTDDASPLTPLQSPQSPLQSPQTPLQSPVTPLDSIAEKRPMNIVVNSHNHFVSNGRTTNI